MIIERYAATHIVRSWRDPLEDLVVQLQFLRAEEYLVEIAHSVHGIPKADTRSRARIIASHVRAGEAFIDQALGGPQHTAFLPLYYAVLNLLKVYVLLSPRHAELPKNRWHGATYDVCGKSSHSLQTEVITLRDGGAIPLFYRVVTGLTIKDKTKVALRDICPYIRNASAEWKMAAGANDLLVGLSFDIVKDARGRDVPRARVFANETTPKSVASLKVLNGFKKVRGKSGEFVGQPVSAGTFEADTRAQLRPYLIFSDTGALPCTPVSARDLLWPEELPITLLFFYMSSVTRYRPDFLDRLTDSKYWPFLASARSHALTKFLLLLWSFVHRENYSIVREFPPK